MIEIAIDSEGLSAPAAAAAVNIENTASYSGQVNDQLYEADPGPPHRHSLRSQQLYGRCKEMLRLTQALARVSNGNGSEVVFLAGPSGSGKTILAEHLRDSITKSGGVFGVAAFHKYTRNHPHIAILQAFNDVCDVLIQTGDFDNFDAKRTIKEQLGGEAKFLKTIIPELASLLDDDVNRRITSTTGIQTFGRFKGACCRFLNALAASQNRPIVLLFDGLDSADQGSLQVMQSLITNGFLKHILIIGTCRNSDICNLGNSGTGGQQQPWPISTLNLAFFDMEGLIEFVRAALHQPAQDVTGLCEFLSLKTHGNPFHVHAIPPTFSKQRHHDVLPENRVGLGIWNRSMMWETRQAVLLHSYRTRSTILRCPFKAFFKLQHSWEIGLTPPL
jgi:energy-coupling factor transporter ATP-binding protein EcfA2